MSHMQASTYRPSYTSQGSGGGGDGDKRQPHQPPRSGHYIEKSETDNELNKLYRDVGVKEQHTRCPHCLRIRNRKHRLEWKKCTERYPGCEGDTHHMGDVSYSSPHLPAQLTLR